jgi:FkbM family methyltransferase
MKKIYFDVGANHGHDSLFIAAQSSDNIVYAFEPTPLLVDVLKKRSMYLSNYHVFPKAVSNYNGQSTFRISAQDDGCSSLNKFNDNLETSWPGRRGFIVTDEITVDVIKLYDFIIEHNITEIENLHVDAQGQDLEVLLGLQDKINIVKSGVIEMPTSHNTKLYADQQYLDVDAIEFLKSKGFIISSVDSNDIQRNEVNIRFHRSP